MTSPGSPATYRFSILQYQPRMRVPEGTQPVAVVMSGEEGVFVMGIHHSQVEGNSRLGDAVLEQLPHIISEQLEEADRQDVDDYLAYLASQNEWNLYLSDPEECRTETDIQAATFQVFMNRVASYYLDREARLQRSTGPAELDNIFLRSSRAPRRAVRA